VKDRRAAVWTPCGCGRKLYIAVAAALEVLGMTHAVHADNCNPAITNVKREKVRLLDAVSGYPGTAIRVRKQRA